MFFTNIIEHVLLAMFPPDVTFCFLRQGFLDHGEILASTVRTHLRTAAAGHSNLKTMHGCPQKLLSSSCL